LDVLRGGMDTALDLIAEAYNILALPQFHLSPPRRAVVTEFLYSPNRSNDREQLLLRDHFVSFNYSKIVLW
jgi:hypothetical protein